MRPRLRARVEQRVRWWLAPKLGRLQQHPPEPLRVPRSYARTRPPDPPPAITIVTPSYQQRRFLGRTIRSVLDQGYPALEYVVQDGGSTDGSVEVLREHERDLTRWESAPDRGQANAINRGFEGTSGELMAYLNSDDVLLPGALAHVASFFAEHPEVDAVYGNRVVIDEAGRKIGIWVLPGHDGEVLRLVDFVPQETLFWRRRLWERCGGGMDEGFGFALDWELLLRFADANARIAHLPRFLAAFRFHEEQKTSAHHAAMMAESHVLRERALGQPMPHSEAMERVEPFLRRHVPRHLSQRALERMPRPRVAVDASPLS